MVDVGTMLPDVTLPLADGGSVTIGPGQGRPLLLFFYPKADTPGCTSEAKDFSALYGAFGDAGVDVVGVSRDGVAKLARFAEKHDLAVPLASDATGALSDALGLWVEKAMYGRTYMGMERTTILTDAHGRVATIWPRVKVRDHAATALESVRAAQRSN